MRATYAQIDLSAIAHNVSLVKQNAGKAEMMAVVKADAYGHGAIPVARTALENGANWLAVATAEEAEELRDAGFVCPVLVLRSTRHLRFGIQCRAAVLDASGGGKGKHGRQSPFKN